MASPEQELAGFLRRVGGTAPVITCISQPASKDCPAQHVATCVTEAVEWQGHHIPATISSAEAPKKKAAQRATIEQAIGQLKCYPAWAAARPADRVSASLLHTLERLLSDQELRRNVEVEAAVLLAQHFSNGWLTFPPLLYAGRRTLLASWAHKHLAGHCKESPAATLAGLRDCLMNEIVNSDSSVEVDKQQWRLRRRSSYEGREGEHAGALVASLDHMAPHRYRAVLVPHNSQEEVREVVLDGDGLYTDQLAAALGGSPDRLWSWGIANRNFTTFAVAAPGGGPATEGKPGDEAGDSLRFEAELNERFGISQAADVAAQSQLIRKAAAPEADDTLTEALQPEARFSLREGVVRSPQSQAAAWTGGPCSEAGEGGGDPVRAVAEDAAAWPSSGALHPTMYSLLCDLSSGPSSQQGWNLRAGWTTGKAVRGDVILTRIRPRPWMVPVGGHQVAFPLMRAGHYPLAAFLATAAAVAPQAVFARHVAASLAGRLPTDFMSADLWAGPPPQSLLDEVAVPGVCGPGCRPALGPPGCPDEVRAPTPGQKRSRPPALEPTADSNCDGVVCECAVPLLAADRLIEMSDRCRDLASAEGQAALRAVAALQRTHCHLWAPALQQEDHLPQGNPDPRVHPKILHPGFGSRAPLTPGMKVKVAYAITATSSAATSWLLEKHDGLSFTWGCGGAMAEVQHLASILAVGGSAHCPVHVNLPCSSDEAAPLVPLEADLTLRLLSISLPPSGTPATSRVFSPPSAVQRRMFVERVLRGAKARRVADLGCGDGALLLHLAAAPHPPCATQSSGPSLGQDAGDGSDGGSQTPQVHHPWHQHHHHQQQPTGEAGAAHMAGDATSSDAAHEMPFRELVGVDISGTALARAQKTLQEAHREAVQEGRPRPRVSLIRDHICHLTAEEWGEVAGVDAAAAVEVVEHLDPAPLAALGPALLGALRPRTAVVTTPNADYNPVLQAAAGHPALGGSQSRLRNRDHRFEWTREEFRQWADGLAAAHGYTVQLHGISRITAAALERLPPPLRAAEPSLGCSTQAAVFTRAA